MLVFSHRRTKRRTVMVTLVVWVFALMAAVANACLLQVKEPGDHHWQVQKQASAGKVIGIHADLAVTPQDGAVGTPAEPSVDADAYTEACKNFCDAETAAAAAKQEVHDAADLGHASLHVGACAPYLAPVAVATLSFDGRPPPHTSPIPIRFLRLTI